MRLPFSVGVTKVPRAANWRNAAVAGGALLALQLALLGLGGMLLVNDSEARELSGDHNLARAARWIHERGPRYVFRATLPVESARRSALRRLLRTFFDNSLEEAVATLLDVESSNVTDEELERLARMIDHARKEGR